jgi:hypothetical protein
MLRRVRTTQPTPERMPVVHHQTEPLHCTAAQPLAPSRPLRHQECRTLATTPARARCHPPLTPTLRQAAQPGQAPSLSLKQMVLGTAILAVEIAVGSQLSAAVSEGDL